MSTNRYAPPQSDCVDATTVWSCALLHGLRVRGLVVGAALGAALVQGVSVLPLFAADWSFVLWALAATALSTTAWVLIFFPVWLPMLIPSSHPRTLRAALALCGGLILAAAGLVGIYGASILIVYGRVSSYAVYGCLGLIIGTFFLWLALMGSRGQQPSNRTGS